MSYKKVFFAYPAGDAELVGPIESASKLASAANPSIDVRIWPQLNNFGLSIPDDVRSSIVDADVFACDITQPNFNVYYEAGFAIGKGKPIAPVLNSSFAGASAAIQRDGFFDNIRYRSYENSDALKTILLDPPAGDLVSLFSKPVNFQQPLYFLNGYRKTDFINSIVSAIKATRTHFRSFDPVEVPRFSTVSIIADVSASSGVIVPFLSQQIEDAARHNLRAAFLAGLSHGLERQTLLLRLLSQEPGPADFRDLIENVRSEDQINEKVKAFVQSALVAGQSISKPHQRASRTLLQGLFLGASAAENEFRTLEDYFVETSEYLKTRRGEVTVVAGRKGSGKTAIFFVVRNDIRTQRNAVVTDLKPESHQLSLFRESLLKMVGEGVFDHTLAAFWYFVILSEVLLKIQDNLDARSRTDGRALTASREISEVLEKQGVIHSGDFTARINRLGSFVIQEIERAEKRGEKLSAERLTNIVFRDAVGALKELILKNTVKESQLVLLFDNLDKGWPASGVDKFDIRLLRLLLEALEKVRRDFATVDRQFTHVVFLRNDIYELLVESTPDRGKTALVRLDWTDRVKLRQVIYRRLQAALDDAKEPFEVLWKRIVTPLVGAQDSFEFLVDHCLMRPRFLITIVENAVAHAINRGHSLVSEDDCRDAVRQHANILVDDFGYEIRDVSGISADVLYSLIGATKSITRSEVLQRFAAVGIPKEDLDRAFDLMIWYGVLGITVNGREKYIYDYDYNEKRVAAEIAIHGTGQYVINEAFHVVLNN
ncbi:hypothetical protein ACVIHI_002580 [Bradyrhizobium sp. USDA 4524]|uniref:P-loop ATPase, Sll1717 family n=1 Tax=unclassified Bradyrhizobium TaxID=2631580 RepID=UPI00209EAEAE|nr:MULTISPECIES: hypothetical protein [unclassified Bradyrhizobium]MCP1844499.1 hypothetical protein [Bradyrhizobium sp. USDA 4538]MCP1905065.1 hypothetical protein [Bradyrhizobium sp. USDA 4537]MCP1989279.1 hypothetical protein [Bradyrhizobium sp. USDA 4539]